MSNYNIKALEKVESKTKIYLVIIAILLIILCISNVKFIIPSIILYVVIIAYTIWVYNKRKGELSSYINELTFSVDSAAKNTLINSPFPLIILETTGNVLWRSSKFNKEFANVGINAYIDDLAKEIKAEIQNNNFKVDKKVNIDNKIYHVIGEFIKMKKKDRKKENKYIITLYFIDITKEIDLTNEYNNAKTCVGIVMLDNYEEIIQRIAEESKPQVIAAIEKKLYEWASAAGGLIIKKERDTYVFVIEQKYLEELENNKFTILDEMKEIETDEGMPITLTIAISNEGESNYEKYESALVAIDIALGRGGDQAVIRQEGKYTFFGGKTQEVEKRTKVKARVISHALEELIKKSDNVIVMGHVNGDIDSIGSSLGIYRLAKTFDKEAYVVNNTYGLSLENFITTLKEQGYGDVIIDKNGALNLISSNSLLVVVDTHKKSYVEVPELLEKTEKIVVIDHHRKSEDFIENAILTFHEAYASSASELVTEIVEYATQEVTLEQLEAESLYAGIMMDTKNFTFKTGVRTFEAAAYLRKYGIDIIKVKKWFQSDLESYTVIADIVKNAEIINDTIAISEYTEKDKNANLICAKAADELITISDITASFVLGQMGDKICISGRSIGDINVQIILEKMGGGGHITLAGAQLEGLTMEEAKTELIIRINEYFTENNV
jgi:c-di-AMP phosphodiesterase-like protein